MLQRGRKSRSSREFLASVDRTPDQQSKAPAPEPPSHFGEAERKIWYAILRENPHLNYSGRMLLGMAINAAARAQYCAQIIDEAGGPLSIDSRGRLKRHPLAGIEVANRKLARDLRLATPLVAFTRIAAPLVWIMNASANFVLRIFGIKAGFERRLTDEVSPIAPSAQS